MRRGCARHRRVVAAALRLAGPGPAGRASEGRAAARRRRLGRGPADTSWRDVGIYAAGDGRLLLGGTEDRAGFDEAPSASGRERILAGAERLLPGIGQARVREHWAGLRPVTPDGLPIVGLAPGRENVYLATGAGRKGILYSAGIGLATAEFVFDGETALPVSACVPGREALV